MTENEILQLLNKIENLIWSFEDEKKQIEKNIKRIRNELSTTTESNNKKNSKRSMIGFLPSLLQDKDLFKSNQDIIDFSTEVLSIPITAARKRSRNELIGLIVCEVELSDTKKLHFVNQFLTNIVDDTSIYQVIKNAKNNDNVSWAELIRNMR